MVVLAVAGTAVLSATSRAEQLNVGSLDALAAPAKRAAASGLGSFFNKAERGAEQAGEAAAGTAKKVAARARAQPAARKVARSEPLKEAKKAAAFDFGSLLPKKAEEAVKEPVKEAKKSAGFAFGSILPKKADDVTNGAAARVQKSRPVAAAKKQVAKVGTQLKKAEPKKGGKGLFGGLLPSEDEYIYED